MDEHPEIPLITLQEKNWQRSQMWYRVVKHMSALMTEKELKVNMYVHCLIGEYWLPHTEVIT